MEREIERSKFKYRIKVRVQLEYFVQVAQAVQLVSLVT
jgi:hypothetical protein